METNTIEIEKEQYEHLCKLEKYFKDYCNPFHICPECGSYVMIGWNCVDCGYDFDE